MCFVQNPGGRFAYDKLGRLIAVFLPNPATGANPAYTQTGTNPPVSSDSGVLVTRYGYDELGNNVSQTTPSCASGSGGSGGTDCAATSGTGVVTRWTYDKAGRVLTRTLPRLQAESFTYDALGRRETHQDFRGRTTTFTYHPNTDWLATIDYPTQADVSLSYTTGGQLQQVQDGNGTTTYARDARGRLSEVIWPLRPGSVVAPSVSYQYDAAGNRTKLTTPNQVIDYTFDELNRLKTVKPVGSSVPIAIYGYDGVGNRASVSHDNGITTTYSYNRRNRLTGIQHKLGATLLLGVAYTLDASGLRSGITETGQIDRTVTYTYDGVKRLTSETVTQLGNDRRTNWTYDRTGNRLTQVKSVGPAGSPTGTATTAYVYDANNDRLETETLSLSGSVPGATAGLTTYSYDDAGNTTRKVSPTETIDYIYDDANRMAELQTLAGDVTRYAYVHDGIRLSQTRDATGANPVTTHYLIDPNQPYAQVIEKAEQNGSAAPTVKALYAVADDRIRRYTPAVAASGGNPGVPAGLRYYHADGLGSTRLLTDEAGSVTDRTTFEAFGEIDAAASQQTSGNAFLYTGEQLDPNSGFVYLRARYMNPASGRFTQQDSFAGYSIDPQSLHKYTYVSAGPVSAVDPSGNMTLADVSSNWGATLGSLGRAVSTLDKILSKLDVTLSVAQTMGSVINAAYNFDISDYTSKSNADQKFISALKNSDDAIATLAKNIGKITSDLLTHSVPRGKIKSFVERTLKQGKGSGSSILVYGPTPFAKGAHRIPLVRPRPRIGSVTVKGMSVPLLLELGNDGSKGGTFLGLGHADGKSNGASGVQWFRMDWHTSPNANHGDWSDNGYHFHTKTGFDK